MKALKEIFAAQRPPKEESKILCWLCARPLKTTHRLPCGHLFCSSCLDNYKTKTNLSFVNRSVEIFNCPLCGINTEADFVEPVVSGAHVMPSQHELLDSVNVRYSSVVSQPATLFPPIVNYSCSKHRGKKITHLCSVCNLFMCDTCWQTDKVRHGNHESGVKLLSDYVAQLRYTAAERIKQLELRKKETVQIQKQVSSIWQKQQEWAHQMQREIRLQKAKLIESIERQAEGLENEILLHHKSMQSLQERLQQFLIHVNQCSDRKQKLLQEVQLEPNELWTAVYGTEIDSDSSWINEKILYAEGKLHEKKIFIRSNDDFRMGSISKEKVIVTENVIVPEATASSALTKLLPERMVGPESWRHQFDSGLGSEEISAEKPFEMDIFSDVGTGDLINTYVSENSDNDSGHVYFLPDGRLIVARYSLKSLTVYDNNNEPEHIPLTCDGRKNICPIGLVASRNGDKIIIIDDTSKGILFYDMKSNLLDSLCDSDSDRLFEGPAGIAVSYLNNELFIGDVTMSVIHRLNLDSNELISFGKERLKSPEFLAIDDNLRRLYVSDHGTNELHVFDLKIAKWIARISNIPGIPKALESPCGIAVDTKGRIYLADSANNRILMLSSDLQFALVALQYPLVSFPRSIAVHAESGLLAVHEIGHKRIKVLRLLDTRF